MDILEKEDFTQEDIENSIVSRLEESVHIEFKSADSLGPGDGKKREMAKDVSAFANSDGGLIFYGIAEQSHVASSISFVDGNLVSKEWIENVLISNIQPRIEGLKIFPVRFDGDITKTVFVIKVPRAKSGWPHMSTDKKYYRRFNFQAVPMEEYEVRRAYHSDAASNLAFYDKIVYQCETNYDSAFVTCFINIINNGFTVCEKYKAGCWFENLGEAVITTKKGMERTLIHGESKISSSKLIPIFPNEILTAIEFTLEVPFNSYDTIAESLIVTLALFSEGDIFEIDYPIKQILEQIKDKGFK